MSDDRQANRDAAVEELYEEAAHWHVNTGDETIHAKRIPGKWRNLKWLSNALRTRRAEHWMLLSDRNS